MRVLIGGERSGIIREAFRKRGHDAWSCDFERAEDGSPYHLQSDALIVAEGSYGYWNMHGHLVPPEWDLFIGHPTCTKLCVSGNHRWAGTPEREEARIEFKRWLAVPVERRAIENPVNVVGGSTQIIQPYQFGHDASKRTCLWLHGLPKLRPTAMVEPRMVNGLPRWANQTDSGQNRLTPSETRWMDRSRTYQGIADAMADQWNF